MTQEMIIAEFKAIQLISKGFQVCAVAQDEQGQWHTFADRKAVMPTLDDDFKSSIGMAHTFPKLLEWTKTNVNATHIGAFTNVPNEEPIILFTIR